MTDRRPPMKLKAYPNVTSLAEERRLRQQRVGGEPVMLVNFVSYQAREPEVAPPPSHPAAQALLAGILQGVGEREKDEALIDAGRRLGEAARKGRQAAPERRQRAGWLWTLWGSGGAPGRPEPPGAPPPIWRLLVQLPAALQPPTRRGIPMSKKPTPQRRGVRSVTQTSVAKEVSPFVNPQTGQVIESLSSGPSPDGGTQHLFHRHLSQAAFDAIARDIAQRKAHPWRWRAKRLLRWLGLGKR